MQIRVVTTSGYGCEDGGVLKKGRLDVETIEQLIDFMKKVGHPIIIHPVYNILYDEYEIEIYDDNRE